MLVNMDSMLRRFFLKITFCEKVVSIKIIIIKIITSEKDSAKCAGFEKYTAI